jgi:OmpA-OmpF porin, OOP family
VLVVKSRIEKRRNGEARKQMRLRTMAWGLLLGVTSVTSIASADEGFDANRYRATPLASDGLSVERPTALQSGTFGAVATLSYAHNPLVEQLRRADGSVLDERKLIANQLFGYFGIAYGIGDRLTLHASLPVALVQDGSSPSGTALASSPTSTALGDLRFGGRLRLIGGLEGDEPSRFGLAIDASLLAPTGSQSAFASDGSVRAQGALLVEALPARFLYVNANAGIQSRPGAEAGGTRVAPTLMFAAGAGVRTHRDRLRVGVEATSQTPLASGRSLAPDATALEALGVASLRFARGLHASIGAGPGLSQAVGTPDFRAVARLGWALGAEQKRPQAPTDRDRDGVADTDDACPEVAGIQSGDPRTNGCPDRDADGIVDRLDACPEVAGITSSDPSKNGCPSDRDADGIPDSLDACPEIAGVTSSDRAKNGCPSDRDADGIPDNVDACPDVAGVTSSDRVKNGCPSDRDADGIPDNVDACPDKAGTADSDPKKNGCPAAKVVATAIEISEQVLFEFRRASLLAESETILTLVAKALKEHPEIEKVSIEGHTDENGNDKFNMELSRLRAEAVRARLVRHGVAAKRLSTVGFGKTRPIADNATEAGREKNRRVEFRIVKRTQSR